MNETELETIIMNGNGTLAERVTNKAEGSEFVLKTYAPALLRQQIDRLNLWDKQPHVPVETLAGYFTQYLYMPRVKDHDVIRTAVRQLGQVLLPEQDGFAYADGFENGRYRGLALTEGPVTVSNAGLIVAPRSAIKQIEAESAPLPDPHVPSPGPGVSSLPGVTTNPGTTAVTRPPVAPGLPVETQARATQFHASKELDPTRPVRDISQISDEILTPLLIANGIAVRVTIDIESSDLAKLTPEQVTILNENLKTLGFTDYSIE